VSTGLDGAGDESEEPELGAAELDGVLLGVVLGEVTSESTLVNTAESPLSGVTAKKLSNETD